MPTLFDSDPANDPGERSFAVAAYDGVAGIYLHGGRSDSAVIHTTFYYHIDTETWRAISVNRGIFDVSSPCFVFACAVWWEVVWVLSGCVFFRALLKPVTRCYIFFLSGTQPPRLYGHTMTRSELGFEVGVTVIGGIADVADNAGTPEVENGATREVWFYTPGPSNARCSEECVCCLTSPVRFVGERSRSD